MRGKQESRTIRWNFVSPARQALMVFLISTQFGDLMKLLAKLLSALSLMLGVGIVATTTPTAGASQLQVLYAFPTGSGTICTTVADHCSLDTAFGLISSYDTVTIHLAETDPSQRYSSSAGYVLDSPGVHLNLVSDGTGASSATFDGSAMATSILTISNNDVVNISHVIFQNATLSGDGGAITLGDDSDGGSLTVSDSVFRNNSVTGNGGAIDVGDHLGSGNLTVLNSVFTNNNAYVNGGAIDIGDWGGRGNLTISGSTFTNNVTGTGNGGAIDMADGEDVNLSGSDIPLKGSTTAAIDTTVFRNNTANDCGGAISSANGGYANLTLTGSTVSGNTSQRGVGGAIDSGDGQGSVSSLNIDRTTFVGNNGGDYGGAISNGEDFATSAQANISRSTFFNNAATGSGSHGGHEGGAISNGTYGGNGILKISYSTFAGNGQVSGVSANDLGGAIFNGSLGTASLWRSTVTTTREVANVLYTRGSFYLAGDILALTNSDSCHVHDGTFPGSATFISGGYNVSTTVASGCVNPSTRDRIKANVGLGPLVTNGTQPSYYKVNATSPAFQLIPGNAFFNNNGTQISLCGAMDQSLGQVPAGDRCSSGSVDTSVANSFALGTGSTISQFALDSSTLTSSLKAQIATIANTMIALRHHSYVCVGYTDSVGTTTHNVALSKSRASAVQGYLKHLLSMKGYSSIQVLAYGAGVNAMAPNSASSRSVIIRMIG